jgi:hypothetical protein
VVELRTTNDVGNRTLRGAPGTLSTNICAAVRLSLTNKPFPQRALPVTDRCSVGAPNNHAVSGFDGNGHTATRGVIEKADYLAGFGIPGPQHVLTRGDQSIRDIYRESDADQPSRCGG